MTEPNDLDQPFASRAEAAEQQVKEQVTPEQLLAVRAESLYEQIGGDLCICQQAEVTHWCEKCQERIAYILTVFVRLRGEAANAALADRDLAREERDKEQGARVVDSQYDPPSAEPLATAGRNEPVPTAQNCPWCGYGTWNGKVCLTCGAKGPNGR